jgi:hypothetical protein
VAHGHVGVTAFLVRAQQILREASVGDLSSQAINWLVNEQLPETCRFVFPAIASATQTDFVVHFGWCYGDLGSAAVLKAAQAKAGDAGLQAVVGNLTRRVLSASERAAEEPNADLSLCHGAASTHLLFASLSDNLLAKSGGYGSKAASRVFERIRRLAKLEQERVSAYTLRGDSGTTGQLYDGGLLMGDGGVVLAALSSLNPNAKAWWLEPFLL